MADVTGAIGDNPSNRVSFQVDSSPTGPRVFVGAPDYRVFIFGIEVSQDAVAVQIDHQMDENVSTATVTLSNDNEKWIVPNAINLLSFAALPDELTIPSGDSPLHTAAPRGTNTQTEGVTPIAFAKQKRENFLQVMSGNKEGGAAAFQSLQKQFTNSRNFPFIPGRPMIQMNDPIRIFLKNPWNIARKSAGLVGPLPAGDQGAQEEWYFGFTGFIAAVTEQFEAETNRSQLILLCEDIRRLLRYMRTSTSPNVFNFNAVPDLINATDDKALLNKVAGDAILVTGNAAVQAGQVLVNTNPGPNSTTVPGVTTGDGAGSPGVIDLMLFGDTGNLASLGFIVNRNVPPGTKLIQGVLGFNPNSRTIALLSGSAGPEIEQALSSLLDQIYPSLNESDVDRYGADWSLGADSTVAPEPNHLYVILPDKSGFSPPGQGGAANFYWPYDFGMRIDWFIEFRSRLDVINEFVKNVESVWYTTPKGDIVVEFPQYDGIPFNFKAPWVQILQLQDEYEGFSSTEDDRNITTLTIAQGAPVEGIASFGNVPISVGRKFNPELAARYGIREIRDSRPFKYSEDHANASVTTLAALWQSLKNADAYRLEGLAMTPSFRAPIGKPYFFAARNQIAYAVGIHHQLAWGSLCRTVYDFHYIRNFNPDTGSWEKIGGGFGWHWINNPGAGGTPDVTGSTGPTMTRTSQKTSDPTADAIEQALGDISSREAATGMSLLSSADKTRLQQIAQQLRTETDPATQQSLSNEASQITQKIAF